MTQPGSSPADQHPEEALAAAQGRIDELTAELDATNRGVVALIAELDAARAAEAQALADQQVADERERIAHDLYQQVIHKMFGAGLALQSALGQIQPPRVAAQVRAVVADLDAIITDLRAVVFGAVEARHPGTGLRARLAELAGEAHSAQTSHTSVAFRGPIDETVRDDIAAELLSAARTLLAALPPEAAATELVLEADDHLTLSVTYGGPAPQDTHAVRALRTRAEDLGGTLDVHSPAGANPRIVWRLPLPSAG